MDLKRVLTIAGSDSSGGAGVQADLKTIAAHLLYGESAITAVTAQNTRGVTSVVDVPPAAVAAQIDAVFDDVRPDAVKIGMVSSAVNVCTVAERLAAWGAERVVLDPVMVATSGADLMARGVVPVLVRELFPRAAVVTPNIPEASVLAGFDAGARGLDSMVEAARALAPLTPGAVLVKGGHLGGSTSCDVLLVPGSDEPVVIEGPRVATDNTHGTGCTLSSAVACGLAEGLSVEDAVRRAKAYLTDCLRAGLDLGSGSGPVDHMVRLRSCPEARAAVRADGAEKPAQACADARSAVPGRRTHVLVVGGSPERPPRDLLRALELQSDLVVVCDGGADACRAAGVRVDVLVGDGDSASDAGLAYARASAGTVLAFPQDKDDVDLGLALDWVRANVPVPCDVTLTGVTGGRTDHALAVLGLLGRNADLCPSVEEDGVSMRLLSPAGQPRWGLGASGVGRTLSVLALAGEAVVSEEGMRWNLVRGRLKPLDDLGVSNVVEQPGAAVTVHEGAALATLLRDPVVKAR